MTANSRTHLKLLDMHFNLLHSNINPFDMPWGLLWFLLNTYLYFLIQLFLRGRERRNEMNHFCFLLTCALTPSPVIIWFSFDFIFISYPPFCKANRHWIRYGKHTPLYGRYHFYCHILVFCALLLFFFFDFFITMPFPKEKKYIYKEMHLCSPAFLVLLTSTWFIHWCCSSA